MHHQQLLGLPHDQLEELFEDACFYSAAAVAAAAAASWAADAAASLAADAAASLVPVASSASLAAAVAVVAAEFWQAGLLQVVF